MPSVSQGKHNNKPLPKPRGRTKLIIEGRPVRCLDYKRHPNPQFHNLRKGYFGDLRFVVLKTDKKTGTLMIAKTLTKKGSYMLHDLVEAKVWHFSSEIWEWEVVNHANEQSRPARFADGHNIQFDDRPELFLERQGKSESERAFQERRKLVRDGRYRLSQASQRRLS